MDTTATNHLGPDPELRDATPDGTADVAESTDDSNPEPPAGDQIDLDQVERDLNDVQAALVRLNDGDYWTDEVTGDALPDELLAGNPTARTVTSRH